MKRGGGGEEVVRLSTLIQFARIKDVGVASAEDMYKYRRCEMNYVP